MEEQASLMIKATKLGETIASLEQEISSIQKKLAEAPGDLNKKKKDLINSKQKEFYGNKEKIINKIINCSDNKKKEVSELLDSYPDLNKTDIAGRMEIKDLEESLYLYYNDDLIHKYNSEKLLILEDDGEAYQLYLSTEKLVNILKHGKSIFSVSSLVDRVLTYISDSSKYGLKSLLIFFIIFTLLLVFLPFLFITFLFLFCLASGVNGLVTRTILINVVSLKNYLNNSYNKDVFQQDKEDIMEDVNTFIDEACDEYISAIKSKEFEMDRTLLEKLDLQNKETIMSLENDIVVKTDSLESYRNELAKVIEELDKIEETNKNKAANARKKYLQDITWEKSWMSDVFLDISSENKIKMFHFEMGNSLYYAKDLNDLQLFSKLVILQSTIKMHPDYASSFVLDYKYNGGELTGFLKCSPNIVDIAYIDEDLESKIEFINNDLRARTSNILGSCEGIEEFNKLMAKYNTSGERYIIVHIFGLSDFSSKMLSFLRNGPKVGYFFKIYMTVEELMEVKDDINLDYFKDFYEVLDNPMPRTKNSIIKSIFG